MKFVVLLVVALLAGTVCGQSERWRGRGAQVNFAEIEAEDAHHTGETIGNARTYGTLSSEAQGRRAVTLRKVGEYVEFITPVETNSFNMRYSLPDSPDGNGRTASMDLYVNENKLTELPVTSRYAWFYGGYPFNNKPESGSAHHFYDETRTLLDKTYPAGTKIRIQVSSTRLSPNFTIDVAGFELVPSPKPKPDDAISVTDPEYDADPTGARDATEAFQKAVDYGRNHQKTVYIPGGRYLLYNHVIVDNVRMVGAGPWYSVLGGRNPANRRQSAGIFGKYDADAPGGSKNVYLADFAIIGDITERDDDAPTSAIGGSMSDSVLDNLWLQHVKCGAWLDGRMRNFTLKNSRITDTTADGVQFHKGVNDSVVENCFVRNTGDDGLGMWAEQFPNVNNRFIRNTVGIPVLANNIAIYGGKDIEVCYFHPA